MLTKSAALLSALLLFAAAGPVYAQILVKDIQTGPLGALSDITLGIANPNIVPTLFLDWTTEFKFFFEIDCEFGQSPVLLNFHLRNSAGHTVDFESVDISSQVGCFQTAVPQVLYVVPSSLPDGTYTAYATIHDGAGSQLTQVDTASVTVDTSIFQGDPQCNPSQCNRIEVGEWSQLSCSNKQATLFRTIWNYACNAQTGNCDATASTETSSSVPVNCCFDSDCRVGEGCWVNECRAIQQCNFGATKNFQCSGDRVVFDYCDIGNNWVQRSTECTKGCDAELNQCRGSPSNPQEQCALNGESCGGLLGRSCCDPNAKCEGIPVVGAFIGGVCTGDSGGTGGPVECDRLLALADREVCLACNGVWHEEGILTGALRFLFGGQESVQCELPSFLILQDLIFVAIAIVGLIIFGAIVIKVVLKK